MAFSGFKAHNSMVSDLLYLKLFNSSKALFNPSSLPLSIISFLVIPALLNILILNANLSAFASSNFLSALSVTKILFSKLSNLIENTFSVPAEFMILIDVSVSLFFCVIAIVLSAVATSPQLSVTVYVTF